MSKQRIHKLPIVPPAEPENPPKKRRRQRTEVTKLHKTLFEQLLEEQPKESAWKRISDALKGIGHLIYEGVHDFFGTCLGEVIMMCVACMLIAGFIVLFLKLTGQIQ